MYTLNYIIMNIINIKMNIIITSHHYLVLITYLLTFRSLYPTHNVRCYWTIAMVTLNHTFITWQNTIVIIRGTETTTKSNSRRLYTCVFKPLHYSIDSIADNLSKIGTISCSTTGVTDFNCTSHYLADINQSMIININI